MKTDEEKGKYDAEVLDALEMLGKGYNTDPVPDTTFVSVLSGFTPAPDVIVQEFGYVTALVFGRTWRFCQMADGVCRASLEKLAASLGMSERTIIRHLDVLCDGGYLFDTTPDLKNKPHIYADTGKIKIRVSVEATMTQSQRAMTQSQRQGDRESVEESIKKPIKNISDEQISKSIQAADMIMERILAAERGYVMEKMNGKTWKHRKSFETTETAVLLADLCVSKFGEPSKKDVALWMQEIASWVAHGVRPSDWTRMLEIVSEYTTPAMGITGISKAIKFAATERREKKDNNTYVRPEHKPVQEKTGNFVPPPARLRKPGSVSG